MWLADELREKKEFMITLTPGGIVVLFTKVEEETLGLEWRKWGLKLELTEFKMENLGKAILDLVEFNRDMKFRRKILADIIT